MTQLLQFVATKKQLGVVSKSLAAPVSSSAGTSGREAHSLEAVTLLAIARPTGDDVTASVEGNLTAGF